MAITINPSQGRLRVYWNDVVIADSHAALDLVEGGGAAVRYVPRGDVDMTLLAPSTRRSHCPHKGDASYFSLVGPNGEERDAVWSYEHPLPAVSAIAGHLAFYPNKVRFEQS